MMLQRLKSQVGFAPQDALELSAIRLQMEPVFETLLDHFYDNVRKVVTQHHMPVTEEQFPRLKNTMRIWLHDLFSGEYGEDYEQKRLQIGSRHVEIKLPQEYMFSSMNLIRTILEEHLMELEIDPEQQRKVLHALNKILDIDLALMLHAYREAWAQELQKKDAKEKQSLQIMASGLAHELRNPLNAAHLQLQLAQRRMERGKSSEAKLAMELVNVEIQRLAALVQDFLNFARPHPLQKQDSKLSDIAQEVLDTIRPEADAEQVVLHLEANDSPLHLDRERIKQVLWNLIRNALEVSPKMGVIQIKTSVQNQGVRLDIQDQGPGIAPHTPIFEPFFTTKPTGTGLGLAISHRIVSDHQGTLDYQSSPGNTTFTLWLPLTVI